MTSSVPTSDALPGFVTRPLTVDDLPTVCDLSQRCQRHDGVEQVIQLDEIEDELDDEHVVLTTDTLAVFAGDDLAAFAYTYHLPSEVKEERCYVFGQVAPEARRRGIGRHLMTWGVARATDQLATSTRTLPRYVRVDHDSAEVGSAALFAAVGMQVVRYTDELRRPIGEPIDTLPELDGVRVVTWPDDRDEEIRAAKNSAFADHWGSTPTAEHHWQQMVSGANSRRDLSSVALDGAGRVIGHCLVKRFAADDAVTGRREGWIDNLGVVRDWRGRGVATALIAHSIGVMEAEGLTHAVLMVDAENPTGAVSLYTGLGFEPVRRRITHQLVVGH